MWPASVSIVQLMILAIGLGLTLWVWNLLFKSWVSKITAFAVALPILLICVFIAFFKYSELTLIPFTAKMIRTHFLDVTKKYQLNRDKPDPKVLALAKSKKTDHEIVISQKDLVMDEESLNKLRVFSKQS